MKIGIVKASAIFREKRLDAEHYIDPTRTLDIAIANNEKMQATLRAAHVTMVATRDVTIERYAQLVSPQVKEIT